MPRTCWISAFSRSASCCALRITIASACDAEPAARSSAEASGRLARASPTSTRPTACALIFHFTGEVGCDLASDFKTLLKQRQTLALAPLREGAVGDRRVVGGKIIAQLGRRRRLRDQLLSDLERALIYREPRGALVLIPQHRGAAHQCIGHLLAPAVAVVRIGGGKRGKQGESLVEPAPLLGRIAPAFGQIGP